MDTINTIVDQIKDYFAKDPMNAFYSVGGFSGIWLLVNRWRERIKINIRIIEDSPFIDIDEMEKKGKQEIEIENIGGRTTSLKNTVDLRGYTPKIEPKHFKGCVVETDRELAPHKPRVFNIEFPDGDIYAGLLFRTYKYHFTRGRSKSIHLSDNEPITGLISSLNFKLQTLLFCYFGILK